MTTQSRTPSTHIGDVATLMADDRACPHRIWHISRHSTPMRTGHPIDADPAHASLVRHLAVELEREHREVYPALRNAFEATGSRSGARVKGRPDIITHNPDGEVTIYHVSNREPTAEDVHRVMLYMYLLPRSNHGRWRGSSPAGCVLQPDGTERRVEADEVDETFVERVAIVMRQIASDEPAEHRPSRSECGRCSLSSEECSKRIEVDDRPPDLPGQGFDTC